MGEFEAFLKNLQALLDQDRPVGASSGGEPGATARSGRADAIDAELSRAPRSTRVASLREAPEAQAFRDELVNGLIRVDTANRLLRWVNELMARGIV